MQVADRLEIVVQGKRQTAFDKTPKGTGLAALEAGFLIEETRIEGPFELPDHWIPHYFVALHFASAPAKRSFFEGGRQQEIAIYDGICDVIAPQELRRYRCEGRGKSLIVSIKPEALQSIVADSSRRGPLELLKRWHGEDFAVRETMLKLVREARVAFPGGSLSADSLCFKLSEHLVEKYSIGGVRIDQYKGGISGARLRLVIDYIDSHLDVNLKTDDIARVAGLSKYHCGKAFKQSTGMPLHSYVLLRRMNRSRQLLLNSNLSLAQVAAATGFASQSHFTTVFSTRTGATPESYRQMHRPLSLNLGLPKAGQEPVAAQR